MTTIIDRLEASVASHPDDTLYTFLNGHGETVDSYSYRRFHERTNYVAVCLREGAGVRRGQAVLLVYPPGLEFIVAFFACVKLGAVPVPVPPPDSSGYVGGLERLAGVAADCQAEIVLTTEQHLGHLREVAGRNADTARALEEAMHGRRFMATDLLHGELAELTANPAPLLFLQYTSGSTQTPRGVMVSHQNVLANCEATLDHAPVGVSWLPHYHDMGLIGYYLYILLKEGCVYGFSGSSFLKRPLLWLETISRFRATITSAPNFAYEYCLRDDKVPAPRLAGLDLRSMRCMMNASEPVRASTYERFLAKFAPCGLSPRALVVFYGLAENTLSVSGDGRVRLAVSTHLLEQNRLRIETARADAYDQTSLVSCGRPRPGIEVRIVDGATRIALGEGRIGEVWVAGDSVAGGYWRQPTLSEETFGARLEDGPGGPAYLRTGDLGFLHEGELFLCGRLKDMIIIGGRNYYPNDIEAVVEQSSPLIRPAGVAAFAVHGEDGETIAVLAEPRKPGELPDLAAIAAEVRKRCQVEVDVLALVPHGTIAKTSSGKVARQECRRRWQEGGVPVLAQLARTRSRAEEPIDDLLRRLAASGHDEATLADLGVDSLSLVELSLYLEGLALRSGLDAAAHETLFDLRLLQAITVGELRAFLALAASGAPALDLAPKAYLERLRSIESDEGALMRRDARLPTEIAPNGFHGAGGGKILLTGATGFLGSFLLEALLRLTDDEIVTVVRAEDAAHAGSRVRSALERTGLMSDERARAFATRVQALPGDIAQPRLGVRPAPWDELARSVSQIYHCAAEVDYVKPYRALERPNVGSTVEILRLAVAGAPKALHYVSTTFTFGFVARAFCLEADDNPEMAGLNFGYSQSKWVAEQLVQEAARRGVRARIYRPSLVTASSLGRYVRRDLTARILAYMIRHGVAIDSANQVSLLPVDVCANNIVAISRLDDPGADSFHLTADEYYTMETVCRTITRDYGYTFEYMSLERLIRHMNASCTKDDPLYPLVAFFNHNFRRIDAMRDKRYVSDNYQRARARAEAAVAHPDLGPTAGAIVSFLRAEHLISAPPAEGETRVAG
jgi:thioester reductase-like protein